MSSENIQQYIPTFAQELEQAALYTDENTGGDDDDDDNASTA